MRKPNSWQTLVAYLLALESKLAILGLLFLGVTLLTSTYGTAQEQTPEAHNSSFYPIWKLLNSEQKQQFISGYLHGWRDAEKITQVAIQFVRENPAQALAGLEKIRNLYRMSDLEPDKLAKEVDRFFGDPDNQAATLSSAVSSARARLR